MNIITAVRNFLRSSTAPMPELARAGAINPLGLDHQKAGTTQVQLTKAANGYIIQVGVLVPDTRHGGMEWKFTHYVAKSDEEIVPLVTTALVDQILTTS